MATKKAAKKAARKASRKSAADKKTPVAAKKAATPPKEPQEQSGAGTWGKIKISFYDAETLAPLTPNANSSLQVNLQTTTGTSLGAFALQPETSGFSLDLGGLTAMPADLDDPTLGPAARMQFACGTKRQSSPMIVLHSMSDSLQVGCDLYQPLRVTMSAPLANTSMCTAVALAATRMESSYSVALLAYDECISDYINNPKALIDDVRLDLKPIQLPANGTSAKKTTLHRTETHQSTFSAVTRRGYAEVTGLAFGQHYQVQVSAIEGYICTNPPSSQLIQTSGSRAVLYAPFRPCGNLPSRSVMFVQEGCPGVRVQSLSAVAGGQSINLTQGSNGVWDLPSGTTGRIDFQSAGKRFMPSEIEITDSSPMVFVVQVAEQQMEQFGRSGKHRFRFVDENDQPFGNREIQIWNPGGNREIVHTDPLGWFEAQQGATAFAEETENAYAVDAFPLLVDEIG